MGDNCAILDFSQRHLTGHSWTYLRNFWFCRIFSCKITPQHCKNRFFKSKGSPIFKSSFYQSHVMAFGLTIPKWYNTWVSKIFFEIFLEKIFLKIFLKKIFTKNISDTQVSYLFGIVRTIPIEWLC